jgi:hypothetical protein
MPDDLQRVDVPILIADHAPRDISNTDVTGLFFNIFPSKTFAFKDETCSGGKLSKNRLTVLLITNSDATEKIIPLVIGNAQNPRCFKHAQVITHKICCK